MPGVAFVTGPVTGFNVSTAPDSSRQNTSWRAPSIGSEIQTSSPSRVHTTCTFMPVVWCFPEYSPGWDTHDQQGSSVPSTMYWRPATSSSAVGM